MILPEREWRRLINRFVTYGTAHGMNAGGVKMYFDGAPFTVTELAQWADVDGKSKFITDHVVKGQGWMVNLLDIEWGRGRLMTEVNFQGDANKARNDVRIFLQFTHFNFA